MLMHAMLPASRLILAPLAIPGGAPFLTYIFVSSAAAWLVWLGIVLLNYRQETVAQEMNMTKESPLGTNRSVTAPS